MKLALTIFVSHGRQTALSAFLIAIAALGFGSRCRAQAGIVNISDRSAIFTTSNFDLRRAADIPMMNTFGGPSDSVGAVQLWPRSVSWDRAEDKFIEYYVQPGSLKMGIRYNYNFTFNLQGRAQSRSSAHVPDGWYLLTMVAVLPEQTDIFSTTGIVPPRSIFERYVSSYTSYVNINDGTFNQRVSLDLDNMTANGVMSNLYIELIPLAETCKTAENKAQPCITLGPGGYPDDSRSTLVVRDRYVPYVITLPFVPYVVPNGGSRDPDTATASADLTIKRNLRQYLAIAKAYQARTRKKRRTDMTPRKLANRYQLKLLSLGSPAMRPLKILASSLLNDPSAGSIAVGSQRSDQLIQWICEALTRNSRYYRENSSQQTSPFGMMGGGNFNYYAQVFDQCRMRFDELVSVARITHVDRFEPRLLSRVLQQPLKYNLMSNVVLSRGVSDDTSRSVTASQKIPFGILFSPLEAFGFNVNGSMSVSHSEHNSTSASVAGSLTANLDFNVFVLNIHATSARSCLAIKATANRRSYLYDPDPGAVNGFYLCEPGPKEKDVKEIYARVLFHPGPTPDVDIYDPLTQKTNFAFRGDRDISAFFYLTSSDIAPSLEAGNRVMPYQILEGAEGYFGSLPENSTNTIVTPVIFYGAKSSVPSLSDKLRDQYQEFKVFK